MTNIAASLVALCVAALSACSGELRGTQTPTPDGKTYLIFEQLDGPACTTVYVNGRIWPHPVGVAGKIEPGETAIKCWGEHRVTIRAGHTFRFNYWGP